MAARLITHHHLSKSPSQANSAKEVRSSPSRLFLDLSNLTRKEFHAYLHNTISANITFYKALTRYSNRQQKLIIYADGRQHKNEKTFCRLTETGLRLLKTGFSKKPKNPV